MAEAGLTQDRQLPGPRELAGSFRDPFDLAALVSLAVLVPSPQRSWLPAVLALVALAVGAVLVPAVRRSPWTWGVFAAYHASTYIAGWYRLDNHDALIAYWAAALTVAAASPDRDRLVAGQARWMLATTFGLATAWKVLSTQFLSGDFFTYALVVDTRFAGLTRAFVDLTASEVVTNNRLLADAATALEPAPVALDGVAAVGMIATVLTVATIVVEGGVAVSMAWRDSSRMERVRGLALAAFLVGTYLIVPVSKFGVVLASMGIAQTTRSSRGRAGFALGAVLLLVWGTLWQGLRRLW